MPEGKVVPYLNNLSFRCPLLCFASADEGTPGYWGKSYYQAEARPLETTATSHLSSQIKLKTPEAS